MSRTQIDLMNTLRARAARSNPVNLSYGFKDSNNPTATDLTSQRLETMT